MKNSVPLSRAHKIWIFFNLGHLQPVHASLHRKYAHAKKKKKNPAGTPAGDQQWPCCYGRTHKLIASWDVDMPSHQFYKQQPIYWGDVSVGCRKLADTTASSPDRNSIHQIEIQNCKPHICAYLIPRPTARHECTSGGRTRAHVRAESKTGVNPQHTVLLRYFSCYTDDRVNPGVLQYVVVKVRHVNVVVYMCI